MKNLLFTFLLMSAFSVNAQNIPNGDFENWCFFGWFYNPCGWNTNNTQITSSVVAQDSDFYSGYIAMSLSQSGPIKAKAWNMFACPNHPMAIKGFAKSGIAVGDSALASATVFYNGAPVDSGKLYIHSSIGFIWLPFSIPISNYSNMCDSILLSFENGGTVSSHISFDSIYMSFPTSINENSASANAIQIHFDITTQDFFIQQLFSNSVQLKVMDANGKLIRKLETSPQLKTTISISDWHLTSGIYFVNAETQNGNATLKIFVQKN